MSQLEQALREGPPNPNYRSGGDGLTAHHHPPAAASASFFGQMEEVEVHKKEIKKENEEEEHVLDVNCVWGDPSEPPVDTGRPDMIYSLKVHT